MCLILFAHKVHPDYPLVVAANRDEFYERPTESARWWESVPGLLGGRDLIGGGSWFGVNQNGRFAALTNIREPSLFRTDAPSRGPLVTDFLSGEISADEYIIEIENSGKDFNGYNLLLGDGQDLYYYSNRAKETGLIEPGVHGLSNHLLNTPWPKVEKGKSKLKNALESENLQAEELIRDLLDKDLAPDESLPSTGVSLEWERSLSAMYIEMEKYGTRCSTVLLLHRSGKLDFVEKSYIPEDFNAYSFQIGEDG